MVVSASEISRQVALPAAVLPHLREVRLVVMPWPPWTAAEVEALGLDAAHPSCEVHVDASGCKAFQAAALADCLREAALLPRLRALRFACQRWVGPDVEFAAEVCVAARLRLAEVTDAAGAARLLACALAQPGLAELHLDGVLPSDLGPELAAGLGKRRGTLRRLVLHASGAYEPDVPLRFNLRPLAQAGLAALEHFELAAAPGARIAASALPALLRSAPALRSATLRGLACAGAALPLLPAPAPLGIGLGGSLTVVVDRDCISALPRLECLELHSVRCPNGLRSASLERLAVTDVPWRDVRALTEPSTAAAPRLRVLVVKQRGRAAAPDPALAQVHRSAATLLAGGPLQREAQGF
ncbi:hypothetical protein WJX81_000632 [Elliptochloris bilobata]|uniref:Uncharacterized protein n=1 Tax=Elliptochloris bilobata TaxID=381761 RepID=A0AAW1QN33_9CHLO